MRHDVIGDLGTMFLGVAAILIAAVFIAIGSGEGFNAEAIGALFCGTLGVILRILGKGDKASE